MMTIIYAEMPLGFRPVDLGRKGAPQIKDEVELGYAQRDSKIMPWLRQSRFPYLDSRGLSPVFLSLDRRGLR
jgi:hypothetical protein